MGVVYQAEHVELESSVAIKVINRETFPSQSD